jgi:hypothetical protein
VTQIQPPTGWMGPFIASLTPNTGPAAGGTAVTITGRNFTGATAVRFGTANAASFTVDDDMQITAVSPPGDHARPYRRLTHFGKFAVFAKPGSGV